MILSPNKASYYKWKRKKETIRKEASSRSTCYNRRPLVWIQKRRAAKFPEEEAKLHKKYKARRAQELVVDYEWLKGEMKLLVEESGKDPDKKFKASNCWVGKFMRRKGLSVQMKTGKKEDQRGSLCLE